MSCFNPIVILINLHVYNVMSSGTKKNTLVDVFVKSLQKDNAFLKDKIAELQREMANMEDKYKQEKNKQDLEMSALKEDLSTMLHDVSQLRLEKTSLIEKLEEYESSYVPASGSKKMKDALGECRKQLRDVVEKYNSLVDTYDISKQQFSSAVTEANALRVENERLQTELSKSRQLYHDSAKELEDNRIDMANIMKELSELKQAIADGNCEENKATQSKPVNDNLVSCLRDQISELTVIIEQSNKQLNPSFNASRSVIDSQSKLDRLSSRVNTYLQTYPQNDSLLGLTSSIADFYVSLGSIGKALNATTSKEDTNQSGDLKRRLEEAERKVKELSISLVNITNERDRLAGQAARSSSRTVDSSRIQELEKEADIADRKIIELTQRCTSFERSVKVLSSRAETAEKKVKELTASLQAATKEKDSLATAEKKVKELSASLQTVSKEKDSLAVAEKKIKELTVSLQTVTKEKDNLVIALNSSKQQLQSASSNRKSDLETKRELAKKEEEINKLRGSVISMEKEIQQYQQEIEQLKQPPPIPEFPADLPSPEHFFLSDSFHSVVDDSYDDEMQVTDANDEDDVDVGEILQTMIDNPSEYPLDTIDDLSFSRR